MFRRFFDEGLAQSSYLVACDRTRQAIVIDPRRDVDVYVDAAREAGLSIVHAIETHIHADFVSGARELTAVGARAVGGPGARLGFPHHESRDGEELQVGDLRVQMLHTPGHTPEHVCVLVREPGRPPRLFSGDTLFVGAVGRPDLLGKELTRQLAGQLFDSLAEKLLALEDEVEVHPGHGAGSLCGAGIGNSPHSTIGQERLVNPLLQHRSREQFVAAVLADLPETPAYFSRMKRLNRDGPPVLDLAEPPRPLSAVAPHDAADAMTRGAVSIDTRPADAFGAGHPDGAINVGFGTKLGYWAAWVLPPDCKVLLLVDGERQAADAQRQLLRVGIDGLVGYVEGGFAAWRAAALPVRELRQITAHDVTRSVAGPADFTIVDVRTRREFDAGHIEGALHVPVGQIQERAAALVSAGPIATICEGGFRASLAASLLARAGLTSVMNVTGGMAAYRALQPTP